MLGRRDVCTERSENKRGRESEDREGRSKQSEGSETALIRFAATSGFRAKKPPLAPAQFPCSRFAAAKCNYRYLSHD